MEEIRLGDVVQTRKQHPCGSSEWTVIRTGATSRFAATAVAAL